MKERGRQERRDGRKHVSRIRVRGRCYVANFEAGEKESWPKGDGHPLEGKKKAKMDPSLHRPIRLLTYRTIM